MLFKIFVIRLHFYILNDLNFQIVVYIYCRTLSTALYTQSRHIIKYFSMSVAWMKIGIRKVYLVEMLAVHGMAHW